MAMSGTVEGGKRQGDVFLRTRSKWSARGLAGIEKQVAIAAADQPVGAAQDGADLVPLGMIAPVPRRDRLTGEQRLCDLPLRRAGSSPVMGAQIEDVPRLRLPWQRAVGRSWASTLQLAPEVAGRVKAEFESIIQRQDDGVDESVACATEDKLMCAG